ncbi:MAG TPA: GNAT family N-acetyltransferase [bacterium]|nr:GNAT family N-acetyltransferase [bacterium]HPN29458.1 GNAT family N-acetyltransferase [bacterium]
MIRFLQEKEKNEIFRLALQVEQLFGKMVGIKEFENAVEESLKSHKVIGYIEKGEVHGSVIIDSAKNEIAWFVVDKEKRGLGIGKKLLEYALEILDSRKDITVQTFASSIPEGDSARRLYIKYGFKDDKDGGNNPAGIPTIIMKLNKTNR